MDYFSLFELNFISLIIFKINCVYFFLENGIRLYFFIILLLNFYISYEFIKNLKNINY